MLSLQKNLKLSVLLACIFLFTCVKSSTSNVEKESSASLRLPNSVQPKLYYLHITTRIHEDILGYSGNVTIFLKIIKPTDEIVLHANLLRDFKVTLINLQNNHQYENIVYMEEKERKFLRIYSSAEPLNLETGEKYSLNILFNGDIRSKYMGIFRTQYLDYNNQTVPAASTQFEATNARSAFPCFDEPSFKSKFIVSITHGSNYTAISNMPLNRKTVLGDNMIKSSFKKSPPMSTYLLAFAVSNYNSISTLANGVGHRIFLPPSEINNCVRALNLSISTLKALENYIGINYTLPKLDHIYFKDKRSYAMENWGLITYNQRSVLTTLENETNIRQLMVQSHEIAHQWFGNLVSPEWWTYIWLKEGLATYFSFVAAELVHPDWKIQEYFINTNTKIAVQTPSKRPITHFVEEEDDILFAFDSVSYHKASCFIKMFHHAIGNKTFIKGINKYLTKHQYSVANEMDLFQAIQEAVNEDEVQVFMGSPSIADIMRTWTHNWGIPLVTVIRNYNNGTLTIRQQSDVIDRNETWWIPLNFATASNPNFNKTTVDYILPNLPEVNIKLKDINISVSNDEWLIVNKQQTGLYFVLYDDQNLKLITEALNANHTQIHMFNRAALFRDMFKAIRPESFAIEHHFNVLNYLKFEDELTVWSSAVEIVNVLNKLLYNSKFESLFKTFIRNIISPIFEKYHNLSKSESQMLDSEVILKMFQIACHADLNVCKNHTYVLARRYIFEDLQPPQDYSHIFCLGVSYFSLKEFKIVVNMLVTGKVNSDLYPGLVSSIECVQSLENMKYFLEINFDQDSTFSIMNRHMSIECLKYWFFQNPDSRPLLMHFIRNNYKIMPELFLGLLEDIAGLVSNSNGQKKDYVSLFKLINKATHNSVNIETLKIGNVLQERKQIITKNGDDIYDVLKSKNHMGQPRT